VQDPGFERALRGGVTAMQILPGSANLVGGRGFVMKNKRGARIAEQLHFPGAPETLKMACGENPKRVYGEQGRMPSTRMGNIATVRQMWLDAADYRKRWDDYNAKLDDWCGKDDRSGEPPEAPSRDLGQETLAEVLRGHILPQIHCYQADDMLNQIQVADEMGFRIRSFHHAVEAYKIRDVLAAKEISVSTWPDWWGFKIEAYDTINEGPGLLTEAGARAVLKSDSPITNQRLGQEAGKALAAARSAGIKLDENDAIRWVTANAAWALGIDQLAGTLEVGKMADIVVWDRQPLSTYASAVWVFVDGIAELDPNAPADPWSDFEAGTNNHVRGGR
jgi:imidazolonepropionase-like amidohydrolase